MLSELNGSKLNPRIVHEQKEQKKSAKQKESYLNSSKNLKPTIFTIKMNKNINWI